MSAAPHRISPTSAEVEIRRACAGDLATLPQVAARSFRDAYAETEDDADLTAYVALHFARERLAATLDDPSSRVLVAAVADELVGYAHLAPTPPPPCVEGPDPIELARLYLVGAATGRGIGAALMEGVLDAARADGRRTLWLGVYSRNGRAQRFYRRFGLDVVGSKPFRFGGRDCIDPVMAGRIPRT